MTKFLMGAFIVLLLVIGGELFFLNFVSVKISQRINTPPSTVQFPYKDEEIKNSNGNFMKTLQRAKKNGFSLNDLTAYIDGATTTKKDMVEEYLITVKAHGRIKKITKTPENGILITLENDLDDSDKMIYLYQTHELEAVIVTLKDGKKGKIQDLKEGDIVTISDTVNMKSLLTTKAEIQL